MAGTRWQSRLFQYEDGNGNPLAGGLIHFYETGTTTPLDTYSDAGLTTPNTNPIVLDAEGFTEVDIFLDTTEVYSVVLTDSAGNNPRGDDPTAGSDVAAAVAAHNADPDAHVDATESSRGWTQYATDVEAQAMDANDRSLTPANLAALTPTGVRPGLVRKASGAEVETGTEPEAFVSPLTLQSAQATAAEMVTGTDTTHFMGIAEWVANWTATGSPVEMSGKLPGGYTVKVGKRTSTQDAPETFTFGAAFATAVYGVFLQLIDANNGKALGLDNVTPPTTAGFTIDRDSGFSGSKDFYFLAWGK